MKPFKFLTELEEKIQNSIVIIANNKKFIINAQDISYDNTEIREIKILIIKLTVDKINLSKSFRDQLFNYFYQRDKEIHTKSCLIKYLLDKKLNVKKIYAPFLLKEDLSLFTKFNLEIKKMKSTKNVFNKILTLKSFFSIFINTIRTYKNLIKEFNEEKSRFDPNIKYLTLIRTKVENYEQIYLNLLKKSLDNVIINVSPYDFVDRQKKYLEHLKTAKRNYFFYISKVNYYQLLKKAVKIYISSYPFFFKVPLFKTIISRCKVDDYLIYLKKRFPDIREFYINAEWQPVSIYLTEQLKKSKIKVINLAHGLGPSSPIVNFDEFYVFSKIQEKHYQGDTNFKYYKLDMPPRKKDNYLEKKFALFLICYNFINSRTFNSAYQEVINYVELIAREYDLTVYAKYHPDATERDKVLSEKIKIVEKLEDLPQEYKYLTISFVSTYVIELLYSMPFLIINPHNSQNLTLYCLPDNEVNVATNYQKFKEIIEKFVEDPNYYFEYWDSVFSIMKENYYFNEF